MTFKHCNDPSLEEQVSSKCLICHPERKEEKLRLALRKYAETGFAQLGILQQPESILTINQTGGNNIVVKK